ncbi:MAG: flagellar basal body rod protein FlgC [Cyanobacteria bacterium REEB65]|nr:flagellar basal body rod protein FlgC [Cyanobacteria bacterium REEB65]
MMNVFDVGGSALSADRMWLEIIANNLANSQTTQTPEGGPYRRKVPIFSEILNQQAGMDGGVELTGIGNDPSPFQRKYDPGNPAADKNGFVLMPNVNAVNEMVDLITVERTYDANTSVITALKNMGNRALDIGK